MYWDFDGLLSGFLATLKVQACKKINVSRKTMPKFNSVLVLFIISASNLFFLSIIKLMENKK
jgi:hypothetical protein